MSTLDAALSAHAAPPDAAERDLLDHLHARLERAAADRDLLDVAYTRVDSPVGALLLAATPVGVVRVAFEREDHDLVLEQLGRTVSPRVLRAPLRLDAVVRELDEYFAGTRRGFDVAVDLRLASGFRREVLDRLRDVGYGRTATYTAVAAAAGRPRAVRAVGTACATNPVPLVLPCHRVVRSDGSAGGYRGGPQAKQVLLRLEGAAP
jgi:methylated-DNA-[protein]-cysteine S-methyltransferase